MDATLPPVFKPDEPRKIQTKSKDAAIEAMEDVIFGSISGIAGKYIEYPFDTVKVRLQSQPDHLPPLYKGPLDCFKQSIRNEGFVSLYRGISAPLVGAALETSSLFFWERVGRESLFFTGVYERENPLPLSALWLTGAFSGAFTSLVLTPVELIKCKIQVPTVSSVDGVAGVTPTPLSVIREVFRHQGLRGFWHGQLGTLIRETGGCAAWFGSKETVTSLFRYLNSETSLFKVKTPAASQEATTESVSKLQNDLAPLPFWQQAVAGASAGMSYNFLFFPADTIKSRMQTASVGANHPQQRFWQEGVALYNQHGIKGFYRGCGITVMRSAPSSAIIFIIYDWLKNSFHID